MIRSLFQDGEFIEVYLKCDLSVCELRDPKGLYKKARKGGIADFAGITAPYEIPEKPEIILETDRMSVDQVVEEVVVFPKDKGIVNTRSGA
jgi:adenylylsulfate kinase